MLAVGGTVPGMSPLVVMTARPQWTKQSWPRVQRFSAVFAGPVQAPLGQGLRMARPSADMALYGQHAPVSSSISKGAFICSSKHRSTQRRGTEALRCRLWR